MRQRRAIWYVLDRREIPIVLYVRLVGRSGNVDVAQPVKRNGAGVIIKTLGTVVSPDPLFLSGRVILDRAVISRALSCHIHVA